MKKTPVVLGLIFLAVALAVLGFAEGARRLYSGGFFLILAAVLLLASRRSVPKADPSSSTRDQEPGAPGEGERRD